MTVREADVLADRETGRILEVGDTARGDETLDAEGGSSSPASSTPTVTSR